MARNPSDEASEGALCEAVFWASDRRRRTTHCAWITDSRRSRRGSSLSEYRLASRGRGAKDCEECGLADCGLGACE
eukprot:8299893-Alexandrium_andersonii.AAC.1